MVEILAKITAELMDLAKINRMKKLSSDHSPVFL